MSTDVHTLSGAYALNALAAEEAAEFRRHLDECQACREEVRELQAAVGRMGAAEASAPPAHLRSRILAAAEQTPQEPPAAPQAAYGRLGGSSSASTPAGGVVGGRAPRWISWMAAAAAVAVIAGGGVLGIRSLGNDEPALNQAVADVFEADDARTKTVETTNGGELTVAVSESEDEMAVDTRDLPDLSDQQVYQIWTVHGDEMVSAAILSDPESGAAMGLPNGATEVALTVEPSGGSEQPTSDPIVQLDPYDVLQS